MVRAASEAMASVERGSADRVEVVEAEEGVAGPVRVASRVAVEQAEARVAVERAEALVALERAELAVEVERQAVPAEPERPEAEVQEVQEEAQTAGALTQVRRETPARTVVVAVIRGGSGGGAGTGGTAGGGKRGRRRHRGRRRKRARRRLARHERGLRSRGFGAGFLDGRGPAAGRRRLRYDDRRR